MLEFGSKHKSIVSCLSLLMNACDKLPPTERTHTLLEQVWERTIKLSGKSHSLTVILTARWARILNRLGGHDGAEELWNQVLGLVLGLANELWEEN